MKLRRIQFLFSVLTSSPSVIFIYAPLLIVLTVIGVSVPFASGHLIDALAYHRSPCHAFLLLAALRLLQSLMTPALQRFISARSREIETATQFRVLDATMVLPPERLAEIENGGIIAKLTRDTYAIGCFVREIFPRILQATVMMTAASFALFSRSVVLSLAFMAFFPIVLFLFSPFARRFSDNSHSVRQRSDGSFNTLFSFFRVLPLLRTLDAENRFADGPRNALEELKSGNDETDAISFSFSLLLGLLLVLGEIAVLGIAGLLAMNGKIPVGDVVLYQMLFISALQSVQGVLGIIPGLASIREGADSLCESLEVVPQPCGNRQIGRLESLSFDHVSFAYAKAPDRPVVRDFSTSFQSGSVIALAGANGAGKSTLLKLAANFLMPQKGQILINGHPFSTIDIADFRRRIGIVCQDNLLVPGTIRDNITLRDTAFSQDDLNRALALSGFDDIVRRLPNGLDTLVGTAERNLSGGERQRLAIARAIIRDPLILILDEATNHLDAESRKQLADAIVKLRQGRLIFIAGHDSELDKLCDMKISCQTF